MCISWHALQERQVSTSDIQEIKELIDVNPPKGICPPTVIGRAALMPTNAAAWACRDVRVRTPTSAFKFELTCRDTRLWARGA